MFYILQVDYGFVYGYALSETFHKGKKRIFRDRQKSLDAMMTRKSYQDMRLPDRILVNNINFRCAHNCDFTQNVEPVRYCAVNS